MKKSSKNKIYNKSKSSFINPIINKKRKILLIVFILISCFILTFFFFGKEDKLKNNETKENNNNKNEIIENLFFRKRKDKKYKFDIDENDESTVYHGKDNEIDVDSFNKNKSKIDDIDDDDDDDDREEINRKRKSDEKKKKKEKKKVIPKINTKQWGLTKFKNYKYTKYNRKLINALLKDNYFNIYNISCIYSEKYNISKLEYNIGIYDKYQNLIKPSDLTLYDNLHVMCFLEINNITIYSIPNIYKDMYFNCIEYFNINESFNFGIKMYKFNFRLYKFYNIYFFSDLIQNYTDIIYENDDLFDPETIEDDYEDLIEESDNHVCLKQFYLRKPHCDLKQDVAKKESKWYYKNIYNNYFCFCLGEDCIKELSQSCKYKLYKTIVDNNQELYPKTDYIFVDFIFNELSSDDTFPVFQEMINKNYPAHYITQRYDLKRDFCKEEQKCLTILHVNKDDYYRFGDFIEKYLTLILKIKAVVSCKESTNHPIADFFYEAEYINYIAVGHGVCYFKDYLFGKNRIYGRAKNNKILIPPAEKLLRAAQQYGWLDQNIIKINLPRWDRFSNIEKNFQGRIVSNSILIMFTWRNFIQDGLYRDVVPYYNQNITEILENPALNSALRKYNITIYFTFHRYVSPKYINKYNNIFKTNKYIQFIEQNEISECLAKTNLVVSDFSSIIFDIMSRGKPYIIFVPDTDDPEIEKSYTDDYIRLISRMKYNEFNFENICYNVEETVEKIIYYIKHNFKLEKSLKKFYDTFDFEYGNNTNKFIEYLLQME